MNSQFDKLRVELNSLGYPQKLHPECIPLVKKLLSDLDVTTINLQKYMKISQYALEEKDLLESAAEPYKCDNAKLIKECNDLHLAFIHFKEQHERIQRDLRKQLLCLQTKLDNCILEKQSLIKEIQQINRDKMKKGSKSQDSGKDKQVKTNSEKKMLDELNEIRGKYQRVVEENAMLENQLIVREEEIKRLHSRTENSRSLKELNGECCYKNFDNKIKILQDEINRFKLENNELKLQTDEALAKQHEAMRRALHLLERNKQLEKEIKEMDQIALTVETQCNDSIRTSSQQVDSLARENSILRKVKMQLTADLEAVRLEKGHIQKQLDYEIEDKKRLTERINNYTLIENDLNVEIDRLTLLVGEQKMKIAELENQVEGNQIGDRQSIEKRIAVDSTTQANEMSNRASQTAKAMKSLKHVKGDTKKAGVRPKKNKSPTKIESVVSSGPCQKCCCESGNCIKNFKDLLDKELEFRQASTVKSLEVLKDEKEYFMREYHKALEQLRNNNVNDGSDNLVGELKQQLREKDATVSKLEAQMQLMTNERTNLMTDSESNICMNPNCKRRLREMDIQRDELRHLEMENNTLKTKLQTLNEATLFNEDRMKKAFQDMEEHIRKLEDERRDLVKAEVTQRSNISHLEEDYKTAKEQLRLTQMELSGVRTNYNQLKLLHEQTDRSLAEVQAKMLRAETELAQYQSRVKDSTRESAVHDREIVKLNSDVQIMKNQLTKIDKEKDDLLNKLDDKTEENALLEDQLEAKNKALSSLEAELKELRRKLSKFADESSSRDQVVRSKQQELSQLEQEFDREKRLKEAAVLENKRLQNDLTCVSADCRDARAELEICRRQIEDLKRQLQQYVAEVKRTEDLISQKEFERSELLDQFKNLSQEHNLLESNNHTLENEATQSKIQLSVALDHTTELERRVHTQESMIRSYEKQIADLSAHVASLEMQLQQESMAQERNSLELKQMRDLCVRLDKDKDLLKSELMSKEEVRSQVGRKTDQLRSEKEYLEKALEKEKASLEGVERLLNEARQEVMDQRLLNQDLQSEVTSLKNKITELQERLKVIEAEKGTDLNRIQDSRISKRQSACGECPDKCRRVQYAPEDGLSNFSDEQLLNTFSEQGSRTLKHTETRPSVYSTKSINADTRKFHGSDGILDGCTDLSRLWQGESRHLSRQFSLKDVNAGGSASYLTTTKSKDKCVTLMDNDTRKNTHAESERVRTDLEPIKLQAAQVTEPEKDESLRELHEKRTGCGANCDGPVIVISPRFCRCQTCLSNISISEPSLHRNCLSARTTCGKKNGKSSKTDKKSNRQTSSRDRFVSGTETPSKTGEIRTHSEFDQESESSAIFRKIFSIDGVGLECRCCISSFKD